MDEISGGEFSRKSCTSRKTEVSGKSSTANGNGNAARNVDKCCDIGRGQGEKCNLQEGDRTKICVQELSNVSTDIAENSICQGSSTVEDDLDEKEKTDATPENLKKIDDVIFTSYVNEGEHHHQQQQSGELKIVEDESPSKHNLAFTIDFGVTDSSNSAAAAAKYRNIMERFQNRHKRGSSMSKLDEQNSQTTHATSRVPRVASAQTSRQHRNETTEVGKVKLRIRERSTSGVRDSSKRHSWSPRSSTHESSEVPKFIEQQSKTPMGHVHKNVPVIPKPSGKITSEPPKAVQSVHKFNLQYSKDDRSSNFSPRSTAMQLALNKFDFSCPQPPLEQKKFADDCDSVSETGTYTLDGDNYTEEQKELMNIDKSARQQMQIDYSRVADMMKEMGQIRPNELPLTSSPGETPRRNNVLEVNYYHGSTAVKPKVSYLEKIKSRVRNITKPPDKKHAASSDVGTFTSVTTSGVLSKKPTLDPNPKLARRNSLTKSHVDSSQYVSADGSVRSISSVMCPSTYTDHQKAEYKLSLFTNQTEYYGESPPTPNSPTSNYSREQISETGLKTAQTKNDWIQEWARNARARSISVTKDLGEPMSRSYDCEAAEAAFNECAGYLNKQIDRFRNHRIGTMEYSSDTNVSAARKTNSTDASLMSRPPLSPSRIPSPMHSIGRTRGIPRTRGSLQDLSPLNSGGAETDVYLQKTATAISNLAQSLSRKSSLQSCKSPPSANNSPRRMYQHHYSADEYSPPHTGKVNAHKRNLSLDYRTNVMSQSLNNDGLGGLLDFRNKQRSRQNSFDAVMDSPTHRGRQGLIDQTQSSTKQFTGTQSPLRRSSSFSVKPLSTQKNSLGAAKNVQSIIPVSKAPIKNPIQKSASSASFRKIYSDYDDNVGYYINDEDDLIDDYCSSEEFENREEYYKHQDHVIDPDPEPLTNTRINKAHLLRVEKSKQKVAGMSQQRPNTAGVVACPNTPEMPRRSAQSALRSSMRQSVPRDSSLNRLRGEVPNSLDNAKKQLLQTANTVSGSRRIQPKYMDISKYKPVQSANFLRKNESKSTLVPKPEIKRSASGVPSALSRGDPTRVSNRSVKSTTGRPTSSKRDSSVSKQKETELAMWKRRSTYDPMKAAAEGRRKHEEAKKSNGHPRSSDSSAVLRSQSFHSGVGTLSTLRAGGGKLNGSIATDSSDQSHRWTLTSTESSDEEDDGMFVAAAS